MKNNLYLLILLAFTWSTEYIFVACEGNFYEGNGSLWTITEDDIYEYQENPLGDIVQSLYVFENLSLSTVLVIFKCLILRMMV